MRRFSNGPMRGWLRAVIDLAVTLCRVC